MENASKALIMAGAILIAILLISAGLIILNSTDGVRDQSKQASDLLEVEIFNSNFTKYCGERVLGSKVKELQNFTNSYRAANGGTGPTVFPNGITIIPSKYYTVEPSYDDNGYVTTITVSEPQLPNS